MGQTKKPLGDNAREATDPHALDWNPLPSGDTPKPPSLQAQLKQAAPAADKPSAPPVPAMSAGEASKAAPPPLPAGDGSKNTARVGASQSGPRTQPSNTREALPKQSAPSHAPSASQGAVATKPTASDPTEAMPAPKLPQADAQPRLGSSASASADAMISGSALPLQPPAVPGPDDEPPPERRKAKRRPAGPSRTQIAANDDAPSIGGLIYALNQAPSNRPFVIAAIASGLWLVAGIVLGYIALGPDIAAASSFAEFIRTSALISTIGGIVGPIVLIWFLAFLAWRSEELHLRSTAMTEVAVRLAEPDRMAEGQVASLGQTVRREVDYMNEAVSQALDRASELDAIMKSEVSALERSYEDNERKIRGLLQELASERNSLTGTGEHFRQTLSHLAEDVPILIERLSQQQSKLSGLVTGAGENLTALEQSLSHQTTRLETTLESRSEQMQSLLTDRTRELDAAIGAYASQINTRADDVKVLLASQAENVEQTLGDYASALGTILDQRTKQIVGQLDGKADAIGQKLTETGSAIDDVISQRTETLQTVFEEYALALDTTLANRATALDTQLVERTKALDEAFNDRLQLFDEAIVRSTSKIDNAIAENAHALTSNMETQANLISDTINKQAADLDANLLRGISSVRETSENISRQSIRAIEGLANQADMLKSVSENLLGQINTVTTRFENQGQSILRSANALETANYKIDQALGARTEALNETLDRMSLKAEEIGSVVDGYSSDMETRMTDAQQRTRLLTEELSRDAEQRSRSTIDHISRLKTEAIREKDRALEELRAEFETVTREVTERLGVLTHQFSQTSGDVRLTARRAAEGIEADQMRLKAQLDQLPTATKETSEAMRRALNDQLRAIDQLAQYARSTGAARDVRAPSTWDNAGQPANRGSADDRPRRSLSSLTSTLANEINQRPPGSSQSREIVPAATGPAERQDTAGRGPGTSANTDGKPWIMGDLLARASLDDETDGGAALDIQAIARAIDPSLAAAIWARIQAGQRGFMVTSIYPQQARTLFDKTRDRYGRGDGFRANVEQFLNDFDGMLRNAQAQDPSGKAMNDLIVSESGRVYLFLSHASGRLT